MCVGVNRCRMCRGKCCSLVNDVINVLGEHGEIDPDAEVLLVFVVSNTYIILCFRITDRLSLISL